MCSDVGYFTVADRRRKFTAALLRTRTHNMPTVAAGDTKFYTRFVRNFNSTANISFVPRSVRSSRFRQGMLLLVSRFALLSAW